MSKAKTKTNKIVRHNILRLESLGIVKGKLLFVYKIQVEVIGIIKSNSGPKRMDVIMREVPPKGVIQCKKQKIESSCKKWEKIHIFNA